MQVFTNGLIYKVGLFGAKLYDHTDDNLTTLKLPEKFRGRTVNRIGDYSLSLCSSLAEVDLPKSVVEIEECAFLKCTALKTIKLPDGIKTIGYYAFSSCSGLESISLPKNIRRIRSYAFFLCGKLENIIFRGTKDDWRKVHKEIDWDSSLVNHIVHCTDGNLDKFCNDTF